MTILRAHTSEVGGAAVTLTVNGEPRTLPTGSTVAALLAALSLPPGKVAVERNREIVPRSQHDAAELADGDVIELVAFVGGG